MINPNFYYPLYRNPEQQRAAFNRGEVTHKKPNEMNRHERRRAEKIDRADSASRRAQSGESQH